MAQTSDGDLAEHPSPRHRALQVASIIAMLAIALLTYAFGRPQPEPTPSAKDSPVGTVPPPLQPQPAAIGQRKLTGLSFTNVTAESGLNNPHQGRVLEGGEVQTGGAAVADFDNDGDMDVFLTRVGLPNLLLENSGDGVFANTAAAAGVEGAEPDEGYSGALFADYDGDGWLDLLLQGNRQGSMRLYRNSGDGTFVDVTSAAGIGLPELDVGRYRVEYSSAFADWDHDGDLDLLTLEWYKDLLAHDATLPGRTNDDLPSMCQRATTARTDNKPSQTTISPTTRLWQNQGDGTFADVTSTSGIDVNHLAGFTPTFTDIDNDGWEDILIAGDYCTSRVYLNDSGRGFVDRTEESGAGTDENGMGSAVADIDGDGHLDWFVSGISYPTAGGGCPIPAAAIACSGNRLYLGRSDGTFSDATDEYGVRDSHWGWGTVAADLNNDSHLDLVLGNGYRDGPETMPATGDVLESVFDWFDNDPTSVWLGGAQGPWPEVASAIGIQDAGNTKALIAFDMEGDGDLDLLLANTETPPILYRNDLSSDRHWLTLRLRQGGMNGFAIGARVRVDVNGDGQSTPMEVRASGSFQGSAPTDLHVGLGSASSIATIEIWWPGQSQPQLLRQVPADQLLTVTRNT